MSYRTLEVELENGRVRPSRAETLPEKAHAWLTFMAPPISGSSTGAEGPALTCAELAERCRRWAKLPPDEAGAFADDVESARQNLPPLKSQWD